MPQTHEWRVKNWKESFPKRMAVMVEFSLTRWGQRAACGRWHRARNIFDPTCEFCVQEMSDEFNETAQPKATAAGSEYQR